MFFKRPSDADRNLILAEKIKNDLASAFREKGIDMIEVRTDMKRDKLNISFFINRSTKK